MTTAEAIALFDEHLSAAEESAWAVIKAALAAATERAEQMERERDALMGLIVQPWTREDGAKLFKVNLAWWDTFDAEDKAIAAVRARANLDATATEQPAKGEGER